MGKHFCTVLFTCKFQYYYYLLTLQKNTQSLKQTLQETFPLTSFTCQHYQVQHIFKKKNKKNKKETTLLHTAHLKIHILDANKHPLLLIIVMSVQFVPCALKQADGKVVFILSTSLINHVFDVLSRHSLNKQLKAKNELTIIAFVPKCPLCSHYSHTVGPLLIRGKNA